MILASSEPRPRSPVPPIANRPHSVRRRSVRPRVGKAAPAGLIETVRSVPAVRSPAMIAAPTGIFETDAAGAYTFVNTRWCDFAGIPAEAALGAGWILALHPDDRDRVVAEWQAAVSDGRDFSLEFRFQRAAGDSIWLDGRATTIGSGDGETVGYVGVLTDISAAVEARRQLTSEQQFVDAILQIAGSLICVFDPEGRFLRFNRACEIVSGYSSEEIAGRPFFDFLIPEAEVPAVKAALGRLRAGEPPTANENNWLIRDGSLRLISWSNASFFDADGALTHIVSTGIDITEQRRTEEALRGVEAVGTLLARTGPTAESMAAVLAELSGRMGYAHLAVFLREGDHLNLAAQRGYETVPIEIDPGAGIVGRVFRTAEPAMVDDVWSDPDYLPGDLAITCEIAVPLIADGETLGVMSIGSTVDAPLRAADLRLAQTVAERLSVALQLGREQQVVSDRARLLAAVSAFARQTNGVLDSDRLLPVLLDAISEVMHTDAMGLTLLDRATGRYTIREVRGAIDQSAIGAEIRPGEGATGRAIADAALVIDTLSRATYPTAIRDLLQPPALYMAAVPLIRDGVVLGGIVVGRRQDTSSGFSAVEGEVLTLLAAHAALALVNAELVREVRELAIHDTLTGLYNRRHFDATLELVFARWGRAKTKRPLSAIFFDLDHFGRFNKKHGHQAGDAVLREFAGILNERFRAADLVARFGGEEFIAILEETDLAGALTVAEEVRVALAARLITGPDGEILRATVSAGCASLDPADPTRKALLRTAEVALFTAKRVRNRVVGA
jgi:diguanylate cyclase (GGDEF)-like protein/PAS domain S-box-containing protein